MANDTRTRLLCASATVLLLAVACAKNTTQPSPSCSFSVVPANTTFGAEGGSGTVAVTAAAGCQWTAVSSASFITITQGASGSGNGTAQFAVAANTGPARTGAVTVAGSTVTLTQAGASTTPALSAPVPRSPVGGQTVDSLRPTLVVANAAVIGDVGTVTYRFQVSELDSFPDNSRTASQDGIVEGSGGTTSWQVSPSDLIPGTLYYWRARAATGTMTSAYSTVETFRTPCGFTLSTTSVSVGSAGGTATVTVTTGTTCSWTATSNAAFISISSGSSGTGNGTITFTVAANSGTAARTGTLTVAGQTVTVTQAAPAASVLRAVYDPALKAPVCNDVGTGCDSGTLLNGSGTTETNQPNTIASACSDGGSSNNHLAVIDSIALFTPNSAPLTSPANVLLEVTIRMNAPAGRVRAYFADDALNPVWTLAPVDSNPPPGQSIVRVGTTFSGAGLHAIRVAFSAVGTLGQFSSPGPGACATGPDDDNDDLVFRIQ